MTESRDDQHPFLPGETTVLPTSDRSRDIDRSFRMLADRRRRFCLYYLHQANEPLSIREVARAVETSLAPPEAAVTERHLDEAVRHFVHTHLPKLHDAGLVRVIDGSVGLAPDPPLPIRNWLSTTAAAELNLREGREWSTDRPRRKPEPTRGHLRTKAKAAICPSYPGRLGDLFSVDPLLIELNFNHSVALDGHIVTLVGK